MYSFASFNEQNKYLLHNSKNEFATVTIATIEKHVVLCVSNV